MSLSPPPPTLYQELVIDLLQSIVELVTYGDRQDPLIFEYELFFMVNLLYGYAFHFLVGILIVIYNLCADILWSTKF